jgi:hypothetical protein
MQSAKSGVSRVPGLPAKLISAPEASIRSCHVLTVTPAYTSHILQPLDVSCFGPLKKVYGTQIEKKMRLGINHILKEEFLPTFFTAYQ